MKRTIVRMRAPVLQALLFFTAQGFTEHIEHVVLGNHR